MASPLVAPDDLDGFPGAPFAQGIVDAAAGSVRGEAGWHIAPSITETITLDTDGGRYLFLPTMRLTAVSEVRDVTGDAPKVLSDWRKSRAGMLYRAGGWPSGLESVEVDLTHGYDACPDELLSVIAARAQAARINQAAGNVRLGSLSISPSGEDTSGHDATVARYTIPSAP